MLDPLKAVNVAVHFVPVCVAALEAEALTNGFPKLLKKLFLDAFQEKRIKMECLQVNLLVMC
jgi:hypothetical protein